MSEITVLPQLGPVAPTGRQYALRHGDLRATVVEVGGALRELTVGGRPRLDGYAEHEPVIGARGQSLIPWPNRLRDGTYEWDGDRHQVPLTEPDTHNAIHGLVRWAGWTASEHSDTAVTMRHRLYPQPGWPFALDLEIAYTLDDAGITVTTSARNLGTVACPYGTGAHPYLSVGESHVDGCRLRVAADRYIPTDDRGLPVGVEPVEGTAYDFREPRLIGDTSVDVAFTGVRRDADGRLRTRLVAPDGTTATLWQDESYPYVEIFTGDTLPARKRRTGVGVEPMTMPPNGLGSGTDVIRLEPGATHRAQWGIEP